MGDRVQAGKMPARLQGTNLNHVNPTARSKSDDDQYYMDRMREILTGFPNTGPPTYPVQILDHLFMGNQRNADNVELLRRYGVTHVLNCAGLRRFDFSRSPYPKESGIKGFLMISAEDTEDFDMAKHFDEAIAFLDRVKKVKGKALVHCNLGVNRSGAVVAAYLMVEQRRTLLEVINYLKVKRFVVLSNKGFRRQLIQFARDRGLLDPIIPCQGENLQGRVEKDGTKIRAGGGIGRRLDEGGGGKTIIAGGGKEEVEEEMKGSRGSGKAVDVLGGFKRPNGGRSCVSGCREEGKEEKTSVSLVSDKVDSAVPQNNSKGDRLAVGDAVPGDSKKNLTSDCSEEVTLRQRLWTLPRYMGRTGNGRLERPHAVEVIVSEYRDGAAGGALEEERSSSVVDAKTRSRTPLRQLEPVYEAKSCDATVGYRSGNSSTGSGNPHVGGGGGGGRLSAAETMSAKLTGLLNLLGPKKPLRSTSNSNVSTSQSPSSSSTSSSSSFPPSSAATSERSSASSGSLQTSVSGSSLSTARPLRIYTRSRTDTEIYRGPRQSAATAGQFGLPRPVSKS